MPALDPRTAAALRAARRFGRGLASWTYGLAISLMLVGLWGRAAAADRPVVEEAASEAVQAVAASDRVVDWIVGEAGRQAGDAPADVEPIVRAVLADPAARSALDDVVRVVVVAVLSDATEDVVIDLRSTILPYVEELGPVLDALAVEEGRVAEVLDSLEPIVIDADVTAPLGETLAATRHALRLAAVVGALAATALFGVVMLLAEERRTAARALAARTFFAAAGFTVMLRVGAWALDPRTGGAAAGPSLRRAVSVLAASNLHLPLVVAAVAGAVWIGLRRRRYPKPEIWTTGEVTVVPSTG